MLSKPFGGEKPIMFRAAPEDRPGARDASANALSPRGDTLSPHRDTPSPRGGNGGRVDLASNGHSGVEIRRIDEGHRSLIMLISKITTELLGIVQLQRSDGNSTDEEDAAADLPRLVDLICLDCISLFLDEISEKNIDVSLNTTDARGVDVFGVHREVKIIIACLLANSVHFSEDSNIHIKLSASNGEDQDGGKSALLVAIRDAGCALIEEPSSSRLVRQNYVWEGFDQESSSYDVGLSTAAALCRSVGGELSIRDNITEPGMTFLARIPTRGSGSWRQIIGDADKD